jgi:hypothetical protein
MARPVRPTRPGFSAGVLRALERFVSGTEVEELK